MIRPQRPCPCGRPNWARGLCHSCYKTHRDRMRCGGQWDPDSHIPAATTTRRLQALSANGWPYRALATELGLSNCRSLLPQLMAGARQQVRQSTALRVTQLYDRLQWTPGPSSMSRKRAADKGWAPPRAWNAHTIDNPAAQPDIYARRGPIERKVHDVRCGDCEQYPCHCHWVDDADIPLIGHLEGGGPLPDRRWIEAA